MRSLVLAAALAAICLVPVAEAGPRCGLRQSVISSLEKRYGEKVISSGVDNRGHLVEVLASPGGATWSVVTTGANGIACMAAVGKDWRQGMLPEEEGGA